MLKQLRLLSLLSLAATPAMAAESPASWAFIESVGGMKIGKAEPAEGGGWVVPLECDLTGLRRISTDPTVLNSTQVIDQVQWRLQDKTLVVSLFLKPSSYATDAARCGPLLVQGIKPGEYEAVYSDGGQTVPLGSVTLSR